jgi:hypothetical protein
MFVLRAATASALLVSLAGGVHAEILYDNIGFPNQPDPVALDGPQYDSFSTGSTGAVNSISLLLDNAGFNPSNPANPNPNGVISVTLYQDGGDTPNIGAGGETLFSVNETRLSSNPATVGVSNLGLGLNPDTRYWIQLSDNTSPANGATDIEWWNSNSDSGTNVSTEFFANQFGLSANSIGLSPYNMCVSTTTGGAGSCSFAINAIATPEPASYGLFGLGLVLLGLLRRRRAA